LGLIECQVEIEPGGLILLPEDHRHSGVNLGNQGIGLSGEDGESRVYLTLGIMHRTPDPGEGKRLLRLQGNPVRDLALTRTFPLIEAIGEDQAAFALEGIPKEGLRRHCLGSRIDERFDVWTAIRPLRHKAPGGTNDGIWMIIEDGPPATNAGKFTVSARFDTL
jgi:hypothetical protein